MTDTENLYRRQLDIIDLEKIKKYPVKVIGCGAVGSFTAFTLAKMGITSLMLYDDDTIEEHNLPNQMYPIGSIGQSKVETLTDMILQFHGHDPEVIPVPRKVTSTESLGGIVICSVDSMDARQEIWKAVKLNARVKLYIDARMGAELAHIFTLDPTNIEQTDKYEENLFPSDEAYQAPCTEKAVIYTSLGISSAICGKVKKFIMGEDFAFDLMIDFKTSLMLKNGMPI